MRISTGDLHLKDIMYTALILPTMTSYLTNKTKSVGIENIRLHKEIHITAVVFP